jgi:hypothetical protein
VSEPTPEELQADEYWREQIETAQSEQAEAQAFKECSK